MKLSEVRERGEGTYPPRSFNQRASTRRAQQLSVAAKAPGQQISSPIMSRPESILIQQDYKGLL